jgi:hypothetical protein
VKDLVKFFEDRNLHEVAKGLKDDLKSNNKLMQSNLLGTIRNAVTQSDQYSVQYTSTNERFPGKRKS